MLAIIPLLALLLMFLLARSRCARDEGGAILLAFGGWAIASIGLTEFLGSLHAITPTAVTIAWVAIDATLIAAILRIRVAHFSRGDGSIALKSVVAAIVVLTFIAATFGAANNHDSMTYHLARVAHWIQNQSVSHYPTHVPRQLYMGPGAEYLILQLQVTSGGDRLANLVQWLAMIVTLAGVWRVARQLGATPRGSWLAVAVAATIPIGILEASTTQNDYVHAAWMIGFVSFAFDALDATDASRRSFATIFAGVMLGLAIFTKGTTFVIAIPFVAWFAIQIIRLHGAAMLRPVVVAAAIALALNAGAFARNWRTFGSPLGMSREPAVGKYPAIAFANDAFGPGVVISNVMRNLAVDLGSPMISWNHHIAGWVRSLHESIGLNADNPGTTWIGETFFVSDGWNSEDVAGMFLHTLLIAGCFACLCLPRWKSSHRLRIFAAAVVGAYVLFAWVFRWQPWHSRLHLPLFVLASCAAGRVVESMKPRVASVVLIVLVAGAMPYVLNSAYHPLLGEESVFRSSRTHGYFHSSPRAEAIMTNMANAVAAGGAKNVGLVIDPEVIEYPMWALIRERIPDARIEHIDVPNQTAHVPFPRGDFQPDVVVTLQPQRQIISVTVPQQDRPKVTP